MIMSQVVNVGDDHVTGGGCGGDRTSQEGIRELKSHHPEWSQKKLARVVSVTLPNVSQVHMYRHTGRYTCTGIQTVTHVQTYRQVHMYRHTGRYTCTGIQAGTHVQAYRQVHMYRHTGRYTCTGIQAGTHVQAYRQVHMYRHTGRYTCTGIQAGTHVQAYRHTGRYTLMLYEHFPFISTGQPL